MTRQYDSKGKLQATITMRTLEKKQRSLYTGTTGVFMQVTLAITFMYLTFISYLMLGITGPVLISVMFLIALFVPYFYQIFLRWLEKRRSQKKAPGLGRQSPQQS